MSPEEELEVISAIVYEKVGNKELNRMLLYYLFAREFVGLQTKWMNWIYGL